ncbi:hypothetical protein [Xanthomonas fragariae]|nr:hypothetical protein [Xanthomonas fragariae]UKR51788.1 hypothetical protein K4A87_13655 [Xanthomonas fragariae]
MGSGQMVKRQVPLDLHPTANGRERLQLSISQAHAERMAHQCCSAVLFASELELRSTGMGRRRWIDADLLTFGTSAGWKFDIQLLELT